MKKEKILVAMSGGVDSSVAAALLKESGAEVAGAYMKNWIHEEKFHGDCPWQKDIDDARAVADKFGIEFQVVNLMKEYRTRVVDYLLEGYQEGVTPNPDVMCNREIKFGVFLDFALEHGFSAVATGHYARNICREDGRWDLLEGVDKNKDQSYFLALMNQNQIARARFPIGNLTKPEVRKIAMRLDMPNAQKKDSQGICFIGKIKMADFLRQFVPDKPGMIVDLKGEKLGEHRGLHLYTLGQRKGIRVASNQHKEAYVVVEKRIKTNELVVAFDKPTTPGLYSTRWMIRNLSFTNNAIREKTPLLARPRYRARACAAEFTLCGEHEAEIIFAEPQRAIAPGQICALYDGETLLGGGIFAV
ncbi:MAG: tRNA 2-thiouridine(34) synthase MnmA [Verrucomicrobiota bacterium]